MSKHVDPEQGALFEVATPPVRKVKRESEASKARPRWSKYRTKGWVKCDDCMLVLALAKGEAPASRKAQFRRKLGGTDLLLCYWHAHARHEEDGLGHLDGVPSWTA